MAARTPKYSEIMKRKKLRENKMEYQPLSRFPSWHYQLLVNCNTRIIHLIIYPVYLGRDVPIEMRYLITCTLMCVPMLAPPSKNPKSNECAAD